MTFLSELGRGANAVTYRVRRDSTDWAMKVYTGRAGAGPAALLTLRRGAARPAWVGHPGLTEAQEFGQATDQAYMIMKLVEGRPLADLLASQPASGRRDRLGLAVAEVLAAGAPGPGWCTDVNPHNIMIEPGRPGRLIDFGMETRADHRIGAMSWPAGPSSTPHPSRAA